jgi:hypothetical protein
MEHFPKIDPPLPDDPRKDWLATMWSAVMAIHRLDLDPVMTQFCVTNHDEQRPMPVVDGAGPRLLQLLRRARIQQTSVHDVA